ncbi:shikimate kinase [Polaribacter sp.]|uniref:shikimate kinase n=1 Tax=Polaribacter sp. TaxID=1920175 RepID=UPI0040482236
MHIVLLGYMASGKSTIGKLLSKQINYPFLDLDEYITQNEKLTIPEIFAQKGEIYFRKKEHEYLKEVLQNKQDVILSLGGGTPCYANNMELIHQQNALSIYLRASIATLTDRIVKHKSTRPLVAFLTDEQVPEFIAKHLFERRFFYEQAQKTVSIDAKTEKETVQEIIQFLQ